MKHLNFPTRGGNLLMISSSLAPRHTMLTLRQLWVLIIVDNWARSCLPSVHSPRRQIVSELCCQKCTVSNHTSVLIASLPNIMITFYSIGNLSSTIHKPYFYSRDLIIHFISGQNIGIDLFVALFDIWNVSTKVLLDPTKI